MQTVKITNRASREGKRMNYKSFRDTLTMPTKRNLDKLSDKFGIEWKFALDAAKKPDETGPTRPFVVVGNGKNGEKVFYDRRQLNLVINNVTERVKNVLKMSKTAFDKLVSA